MEGRESREHSRKWAQRGSRPRVGHMAEAGAALGLGSRHGWLALAAPVVVPPPPSLPFLQNWSPT